MKHLILKRKSNQGREGGVGKGILHGIGGLVLGGTAGAVGAVANEALLPTLVANSKTQFPDPTPSGNADTDKQAWADVNAKRADYLRLGSTLIGAATGGVGGANAAQTATANNYLKHSELDLKRAQLAACKGDTGCIEQRTQYWDNVSQTRNGQMQDSCVNGSADQCHANIRELTADLAELNQYASGKGQNRYTPVEANNNKQVAEKYRTNLEVIADKANQSLGNFLGSSPDELVAKGYLSAQEAKDLKIFRAGTMIDTLGGVILPGGIRLSPGKTVKTAASVQEETLSAQRGVAGGVSNAGNVSQLTTAERATGGQVININPADLRWTQTTAGGNGRADSIRASMTENGYNGPPIDVIKTPSGIVTIDHTRAAVALEQGITSIPATVHLPSDLLPANMADRFGTATTWGEAAAYRAVNQRPPLPADGTPTPPKLPAPK